MSLNKEIWEGWTVQAFIDELEWSIKAIMSGQSWQAKFQSIAELKLWCMDNQPYYKKHIPEVVNYFAELYNLK